MNNSSESKATSDAITVDQTVRTPLQISIKRTIQLMFRIWVLPRLFAYRVSKKFLGDRAMLGASESISRTPGLWGVYCRQAFYRSTLSHCGNDIFFGWQSTFSMRQARIGDRAYIGRRCSLGFADVGNDVMLADGVQILSGGNEHQLAAEGEMHVDQAQQFSRVSIGSGAWLGTNAIIMADVGADAVVGAGAVVTRSVPARTIVAGIPARQIGTLPSSADGDQPADVS